MATPDNWFVQGGSDYARFRPTYPPGLATFLAGLAPATDLAVDVGCGNGQLTALLAAHFDRVIGLDASADQLASAPTHERLRWLCAPAERLPLPDGCASLITAAQAAHWFDRSRFFAESRRVGRPGSIMALVSYGMPEPDADLQPRFRRFYNDEISPWWPRERRLVDAGYMDIEFPFAERAAPAMEIRCDWTLDAWLGYVSTWSALKRLRAAGQEAVFDAFAADMTRLWGPPDTGRPVRWPIHMRVGTI